MEFEKKPDAALANVYVNSAGDALVACKMGRRAKIDGATVLAFFIGDEKASKYDRVCLVRDWDDVMERCRRAMAESCCRDYLETRDGERIPSGVLRIYEPEDENSSCLREVLRLVDPGFPEALPEEGGELEW